jgi:hypothetical protein
VWTEFGKSMLLTWIAVCGMLGKLDLFVYAPEGTTINIVYPMHFNK